jgi:acetyl esterase/lipase
MRWIFSIALLASWAGAAARAELPIPTPVELWPKGAPGATGTSDEDKPAVYPFLPAAEKSTGSAILVCPGGAFTTRAVDFEGVLVARWLNEHGIAAFVLRYRIRPLYEVKDAVADGQRAMQFIRARAGDWRVAPDRIGIMGFSAGAELAAMLTAAPLPGRPDADDAIDRQLSRPSFQVLVYGSAPLRAAPAGGDASAPPPTFMFCTAEDAGHLNGMLDLYTSLRRARVPVEAHFFARGDHGVGMAQGDPVLGTWPDLMFNWLRSGGFLTDQPRVAVKGIVKLDGQPLPRGYVVFTPVDGVGAPPVTAYINNGGQVLGQYRVAAAQGPAPGKYRVEVRQDATRWLSNARNTYFQGMMQKQRNGTLTDQERQEWFAYARGRNLSPSIGAQGVFRTDHPGGKELVVEFKPGEENAVDIEVFSK